MIRSARIHRRLVLCTDLLDKIMLIFEYFKNFEGLPNIVSLLHVAAA